MALDYYDPALKQGSGKENIEIFYLYQIMEKEEKPEPGLLWSIVTLRCPRCRRGDLFKNKSPYKKITISHMVGMHHRCPVCHQKFNLEPGFWFGTIYVSYAIAVLISTISFFCWWLVVGISTSDNRILYWLMFNSILIILLEPWLMRLSRAAYLYFFIKYNKNYENERPVVYT